MTYDDIRDKACLVLDHFELANMAATGLIEDVKGWIETDDHIFDEVWACWRHETNEDQLRRLVAIIDRVNAAEEEADDDS